MSLAPYRRVLARPGVLPLLLLALLARVPITAAPVVLTLHVVLDLHRGFAQAGLLGATFAVGTALGAPLLGRGIDRVGLRPVLVVTTGVEGAFWLAAPHLGFAALLASALAGGLLAIPVFSLSRQALSAMVPPTERKAGFSLDSMGVELSFAIGPAAGIWLYSSTGAMVTLVTVAVLIVAAGTALIALDPPVHADDARLPEAARTPVPAASDTTAPGTAPGRTAWLTRPVAAVLVVTFASTLTVVGTDTAMTAVMTSFSRVDRLGLVFAVWCLASLVGGFVFGASGRRVEPAAVLALLAVLCLPVAVAGQWWTLMLLVIPTGLFCAPVMSLTAEVLTRTAPMRSRGLVLGVHSSALTVGNAVGAPLTGLVVDSADPRLGFVAVGVLGLLLAAVAWAVDRAGGARPRARAPEAPVEADGVAA